MQSAQKTNTDAEIREQINELLDDEMGSCGTYDSLPDNLQSQTDMLEVLIWGVFLMEKEGVLHEDHLGALVSYWQSECLGRQKKAIRLAELTRLANKD